MARRETPDPDLDEVLPRRLPPLPLPKMRRRPADKMLRRPSDKAIANANEKGN
jgi:hypothetical protein